MKISVCIAVYNGEIFLKKSLSSILQQLSEKDEVIIVDDASIDQSIKIIESFNDPRIDIIRHKKNQGVNLSFYNALNKASGDLIFIADQDDKWLAHKVSTLKNEFIQNKWDIIVHDAFVLEGNTQKKESLFQINKSGKGFIKNLWSDKYVGCCMMISKEGLNKILPKKINSKVYYDHFLGLMAEIKKLSILFYTEPLIIYNRHPATHTNILKRRKIWIILKDRLSLLWMLFRNY